MRDERDGTGDEGTGDPWPAAPEPPESPAISPDQGAPEASGFGQPGFRTPPAGYPAQPPDQPARPFQGPTIRADQSAFGQPGYARPSQDQYGQGQNGQGQNGNGQYAQAPGQPYSGQPYYSPGQYAQSPYAQSPDAQSPYSQSPYAQSPYDQPPYGQPPPGKRRTRQLITYVAVALVAAIAGAFVTAGLRGSGSAGTAPPPISSSSPPAQAGGAGTAGAPAAVVNAIQPGVVDISSSLGYQGGQAAATGMVITPDGYVLTNNHVIIDTTGLYATVVSTGRKYAAKWIGYDASNDVAVIKMIGAKDLKTVPIGNSSNVKVGDRVVALGNAEGRGGAVAVAGAITALNRTITASDGGAGTTETLVGMLQTDAAIVPGDSGGPLASLDGHVIGMNTAAATGNSNGATGVPGQQPQNVGFAIPINKAIDIAHKIMSGKSSGTIHIGVTGFLGVLVPFGAAGNSTSPQQQRQLQIKQQQGSGQAPNQATPGCLRTSAGAGVPASVAPAKSGALVLGELCGTAVASIGLVPGDVIISVGGHAVTSPSNLSKIMLVHKPGERVTLTWVSGGGQTRTATITLGQRPPS